jgi:hypothetical protein
MPCSACRRLGWAGLATSPPIEAATPTPSTSSSSSSSAITMTAQRLSAVEYAYPASPAPTPPPPHTHTQKLHNCSPSPHQPLRMYHRDMCLSPSTSTHRVARASGPQGAPSTSQHHPATASISQQQQQQCYQGAPHGTAGPQTCPSAAVPTHYRPPHLHKRSSTHTLLAPAPAPPQQYPHTTGPHTCPCPPSMTQYHHGTTAVPPPKHPHTLRPPHLRARRLHGRVRLPPKEVCAGVRVAVLLCEIGQHGIYHPGVHRSRGLQRCYK